MAPKIEIDEVVTEVRVGDGAGELKGKELERLVDAVARRLQKRQRRERRRRRDARIGAEEQR